MAPVDGVMKPAGPPAGTPSAASTALTRPAGTTPPPRALDLSRRERILLKDLEQLFGGRAALVDLLAQAPPTPTTRYLCNLLGDPARDGLSLAAVCAAGHVTAGELLKVVHDGQLLRAHVEAQIRIARYIPQVAEDVMQRAIPSVNACGTCHGTPPAAGADPCGACGGTGQVTTTPDLARQRFALELGKLYQPKGSGPTVQVAVDASGREGRSRWGSAADPGSLERMQADLAIPVPAGQPPADSTESAPDPAPDA